MAPTALLQWAGDAMGVEGHPRILQMTFGTWSQRKHRRIQPIIIEVESTIDFEVAKGKLADFRRQKRPLIRPGRPNAIDPVGTDVSNSAMKS